MMFCLQQSLRLHPAHVFRAIIAQLEEQKHPTQGDRDGREKDVERNVCRKLNAGQNECVELHNSPFDGVFGRRLNQK